MQPKILFICKKRKTYGTGPYTHIVSSGLLNSARFVNDMLVENGIDSTIIEVIDNNCIDREVKKHNPTHVIIEALWVVPEKFEILSKLHPKVKWIIRIHSEIPFIANEGIAMDWIFKYLNYPNVTVSVNSLRALSELNAVTPKPMLFLPNYYPVKKNNYTRKSACIDNIIDIGCFGAVRPLKNHLSQAIAAIRFANEKGKHMRFHINVTRIENNGDPVLKNLRKLFENSDHELVEHKWLDHDRFLELISTMDMCLQVSFSETFNIVTADAVNMNVPVVVSPEITWISRLFKANPTNPLSILKKMKLTWFLKYFNIQWINKFLLKRYSLNSEVIWLMHFFDVELCECGCSCGYDPECPCECAKNS